MTPEKQALREELSVNIRSEHFENDSPCEGEAMGFRFVSPAFGFLLLAIAPMPGRFRCGVRVREGYTSEY
jgi:hypothetical protein